jgi:ring-1,2-phenylacetyl-CoA epoxidase subunit PaaD
VQRIPLLDAAQLEREVARRDSELAAVWDRLDEVKDPEIPVLSIWDLGILRDVYRDDETLVVVITPTYSGCPAMRAIADEVQASLAEFGEESVRVETRLSPAWTTDWMTEQGRAALRAYGIAPPQGRSTAPDDTPPGCPQCGSSNTRLVSEFGSTACKSLFQCEDCREPFDYFKCI